MDDSKEFSLTQTCVVVGGWSEFVLRDEINEALKKKGDEGWHLVSQSVVIRALGECTAWLFFERPEKQ